MLLPSTSFSSRYRLVDERHDDMPVRRRCADHGDAREVEKRLHVVASRRKRLARRYCRGSGFSSALANAIITGNNLRLFADPIWNCWIVITKADLAHA